MNIANFPCEWFSRMFSPQNMKLQIILKLLFPYSLIIYTKEVTETTIWIYIYTEILCITCLKGWSKWSLSFKNSYIFFYFLLLICINMFPL